MADHRCIGSTGIPAGKITFTTHVGCFITKLIDVVFHPAFRSLEGNVRNRGSPKQDKRLVLWTVYELNNFLIHQIRRISLLSIFSIAFFILRICSLIQGSVRHGMNIIRKIFAVFISVEKRRIISMCLTLAIIPIKKIKPHFIRGAYRTGIT